MVQVQSQTSRTEPWRETFQEIIALSDEMTKPDGFHAMNQKLFDAKAGYNTGAFTIGADEKEKRILRQEGRLETLQRASAASTTIEMDVSHLYLTSDNVTISNDGLLLIDGEAATLDQKLVLQENSQMSSIGMTPEELEMQDYLTGKTDVIPEALANMADKNDITDLTRDRLQQMVRTELPLDISTRISSRNIEELHGQELLPKRYRDTFNIATKDLTIEDPTNNVNPETVIPVAQYAAPFALQ